jgi:hypothetical protein
VAAWPALARELRWLYIPPPSLDPFVCQRCLAVLAGQNAVDPLRPALSADQIDQRRVILARARAARASKSGAEAVSDRESAVQTPEAGK